MNNILKILIIISIILIPGCYTGPDVVVLGDFTGDAIAVMNFQTQGTFSVPNIGITTADELTEALYLKGKYGVIDRSTVNNTQVQLGIKSTEVISSEDLIKLGQDLKANYIVLGKIVQVSEDEFVKRNSDKQLFISFRIIATATTEVIGMASFTIHYSNNIIAELDDALNKMVSDL